MKKTFLFIVFCHLCLSGFSQITKEQLINEVDYFIKNYPYKENPNLLKENKVFILALDEMDDTLIMGVSKVYTDSMFFWIEPTHYYWIEDKIFLLRFSEPEVLNEILGSLNIELISDQTIDKIMDNLILLNGGVLNATSIEMITLFTREKVISREIVENEFPVRFYKVHTIAFKKDPAKY